MEWWNWNPDPLPIYLSNLVSVKMTVVSALLTNVRLSNEAAAPSEQLHSVRVILGNAVVSVISCLPTLTAAFGLLRSTARMRLVLLSPTMLWSDCFILQYLIHNYCLKYIQTGNHVIHFAQCYTSRRCIQHSSYRYRVSRTIGPHSSSLIGRLHNGMMKCKV